MSSNTQRAAFYRRWGPHCRPLWAMVGMLLGLLWLWAPVAWAEPVVILTDGRVAQYREAVTAAREVLPSAPLVDLASGDIGPQLLGHSPAVILAVGQKALASAQSAAPETPIVYCLVLGSAAVSSKTITGVRLEVSATDQLTLLKQTHPGLKRVGVFYDPRTWTEYIADANKVAGSLGLSVVARPISDGKQVRSMIGEVLSSVDGLWLLPDPQLVTAEMFSFLLVSTLERKVPLFGFFDSFTKAGALASVSPDYGAIGSKAAKIAQGIAARPAATRLPVPTPTSSPGVLTINQKTASQLDLELSQEVLGKARQVFR